MPHLCRYTVVDLNTVVKALQDNLPALKVGDFAVKLTSPRVRTYAKGVTCVNCKLEGAFFALEEHGQAGNLKGKPHLNLYALRDGKEVLMTSDHVVPLWAGGHDTDENNRQPMCCNCNNKKGNKVDDPVLLKKVLVKKEGEAKHKLATLSYQLKDVPAEERTVGQRQKLSQYQSNLRDVRRKLEALDNAALAQ